MKITPQQDYFERFRGIAEVYPSFSEQFNEAMQQHGCTIQDRDLLDKITNNPEVFKDFRSFVRKSDIYNRLAYGNHLIYFRNLLEFPHEKIAARCFYAASAAIMISSVSALTDLNNTKEESIIASIASVVGIASHPVSNPRR